jgi:hypothetical protein
MSKPTQSFSPEIIAQIAAVILLQPINLANMTFQEACARAHNLLVAAARSNAEREAALIAAGKVSE